MKKSLMAIPIILVAAGGILTKQIKKEQNIKTKVKNEIQDEVSKCCNHNLPYIDKLSKEKSKKKPQKKISRENKSIIRVLNMPIIKLSVNVQLGFFNNESEKTKKQK